MAGMKPDGTFQRKYSDEQRDLCLQLRKEGLSHGLIEEQTGIPASAFRKWFYDTDQRDFPTNQEIATLAQRARDQASRELYKLEQAREPAKDALARLEKISKILVELNKVSPHTKTVDKQDSALSALAGGKAA